MGYISDVNSETSRISLVLIVGATYSNLPESSINDITLREALLEKNAKICGGKPIIRGTRITVSQIAELHDFLGWDTERILDAYPHLSAEQIEVALNYYRSHPKEIDDYITLEKEID